MLHVAHSARLDRVGKDGATPRAYYENSPGDKVAQEALNRHPAPPALSYLHGWSMELFGRSGVSPNGWNPLTYSEIRHWSELTDQHPNPLEVSALIMIDAVMRNPGEEESSADKAASVPEKSWPVRKREPVFKVESDVFVVESDG